MVDMGKVTPAATNSIDAKAAPISPFGDASGYQNASWYLTIGDLIAYWAERVEKII